MSEANSEFYGIFEPKAERPVMSKPPRETASVKLIRDVQSELDIEDRELAVRIADWVADKMERFGARTAQGIFTMSGSGPHCSWCGIIWPLCGHHHLSEVPDPEELAPDA